MPDRPLAIAALAVWVVTASLGAYMLTRWIRGGGLRRRPRPPAGAAARDRGLPPAVIFIHFGVAVTGLLLWGGFVLSGWDVAGWLAAGLLFPAIGLGICTVTLWTPYPAYPPAFDATDIGPAGGRSSGNRPPGNLVTGPAGGMLAGPAENALATRVTDGILARALTDEVLARQLAEVVIARLSPGPPAPARRGRTGHMAPLVPVAHGMGAITTFLLVILSAIGAR